VIVAPDDSGSGKDFDADRIRAQLRRWQERLLDLTKANPLLGINRSRVSKLRVIEPDAASLFDRFAVQAEELRMPRVSKVPGAPSEPGSPAEGGSDIADSEHVYEVEAGDLSFDAKPMDLQRRLRRIYDNARTTIEERGVTTLYLTFGVLRWTDVALGESIAPLWMVPCELENHGPNTALRLHLADEEMQLNPALELYLRERQRVTLPAMPEEEISAGALPPFLDQVRLLVREQGWSVEPEAWLSTYTFESLVIYQDLRAMAEAALNSEVVAALARARSLPEASEALGDDLDVLPTPETVPVPVLRTDSSQLKAIALAAAGRNLVVHGPPGTGKSQTIANLIADALGKGKKVLFVSAKMAALNVVHERLSTLGLAQLCLEAHSTKAGKAKIVEELRRTLAASEVRDGELLTERVADLVRLRQQLNGYVHELHLKREPLGRSIYRIVGKLEKLRGAVDLKAALPWNDPLSVRRSQLGTALESLSDLAAQAMVFDSRDENPWCGLKVQPGKAILQEELEVRFTLINAAAQRLSGVMRALFGILGSDLEHLSLDRISKLAPVLTALATIDQLPARWSERTDAELAEAASLLDDAAAKATELATKTSEYRTAFASLPVDDALELLSALNSKYLSWVRILRPSYWRWRSLVREHLAQGTSAKPQALRSYLAAAKCVSELEGWFRANRDGIVPLLGVANFRDPTALLDAGKSFRVAVSLHSSAAAIGLQIPTSAGDLSPAIKQAARSLRDLADDPALAEAVKAVDAEWPGGFTRDSASVMQAPLPAIVARCGKLLSSLPSLHEWMVLQHTLSRCRELGLEKFVEALGSSSAREAPQAFERRFYKLWVDAALQGSPELRVFTGARREEQIKRLRELEEQTRKSALRQILAMGTTGARRLSAAQSGLANKSEVGILQRELAKKKKIKPLRKLFAEIPNALQALKPCMLMSPLSVSTFLKPGSLSFDLVVFDEASQIPTQEAIPSILRSKQVVVAGDANQLPPTAFFSASVIFDDGDEDASQETLEPLESLLDDCVAVYPVFDRAHLRWHYRSRVETLIKFSNHYFYDNALITFPAASNDRTDTGVRLEYLPDGIWDRGRSRTNRREARRVAELIIEQLDRYPERSLGVAALNTTQREAIEETLDELATSRPDLAPLLDSSRPEPFFIKSLENVQGDERDTILISVGYGRAADGALSMNFGPLNRDGGWRRLNVLITRAKWHTILVTSLRSKELDGVNPNNRGALALRNFIEYAERGEALPVQLATVTDEETNDFEDAVAEALRERGLQIDQQVGASQYRIDLAIRDPRDPRRWVLGVECDGATYHSARTARDRDELREHVLRQYGWRLHRLWSTDWFRDRETTIAGVLRSLEQAMQITSVSSAAATTIESKGPEEEDPAPDPVQGRPPVGTTASQSRQFSAGEPYRKFYPAHLKRDRAYLVNPGRYPAALAQHICAIVEFEGPIHEELLVERLKEIHGVARAGTNVLVNIERAIEFAIKATSIERGSDPRFLYVPGSRPRIFRVPGADVTRPLPLVPPDEIRLAILYVVEDQFGCMREALPRAVAALFAVERVREGVAELVGNVVDELIDEGTLRVSGLHVYLA
jgi:very-short-patch-repair endonuclease